MATYSNGTEQAIQKLLEKIAEVKEAAIQVPIPIHAGTTLSPALAEPMTEQLLSVFGFNRIMGDIVTYKQSEHRMRVCLDPIAGYDCEDWLTYVGGMSVMQFCVWLVTKDT